MAQPPSVTESTASALKIASNGLISSIKASAQTAVQLGEISVSESADAIAAFVVSVVLGLNAMARCGESAEAIRAAAETAAAFLELPIPLIR